MATRRKDGLIAGFPPEVWEAFTAPLDPAFIERDPNGKAYVRHQVCTDALNRCFGVDGWTLEIKNVSRHEPYTYMTKQGEREGRYFVNAQVRLTIGRGENATFRDGAGAQVASGSWEECEKGAVSEALKRAASLFGFASNVYMTDQLTDSWTGEAIMREKKLADDAGFTLPDHQQQAILDWLTALGFPVEEQRKIVALCVNRESAYALAFALKWLVENRPPQAEAHAAAAATNPRPKKGDDASARLPV